MQIDERIAIGENLNSMFRHKKGDPKIGDFYGTNLRKKKKRGRRVWS